MGGSHLHFEERPGLWPVLKSQIRTAAAVALNRELVLLYWGIGKEILTRQQRRRMERKIIDSRKTFATRSQKCMGFSPRNLKGFSGSLADRQLCNRVWHHYSPPRGISENGSFIALSTIRLTRN